MKNDARMLDSSELDRVVGGLNLSHLKQIPDMPAPSNGPLPCESRFHSDLTACPYAEEERLCYNCEGCSLCKTLNMQG